MPSGINGYTQLEDGTYKRDVDGQIFQNVREIYDTVAGLWALAKGYTEQRKEKLMLVMEGAKEQQQAYIEEMFPELATFRRMEQLEKEYDTVLRQLVLLNTGEKFPGTSTRTTKEVEIDDGAGVEWILSIFATNVRAYPDLSNEELIIEFDNEYPHLRWLTLTKEATKYLQDAVKKRLFEVPADVARFYEKKGAIISDTKLLNGDGRDGLE